MNKQQQQLKATSPKPRRATPKPRAVKRARAARKSRTPWIIVPLVVVIGLAAVVSFGSSSHSTAGDQLAPASLVAKTTSVPAHVFDAVGTGTSNRAPTPIDAPALTKDGRPVILYMGAEYCPYCATERWPMVIALSRFGTFTNLKTTHSSGNDVFPNTQTFSFHGASYSSPYISFTGVEMQSNQQQGNGYATLDTPTAEQQQILEKYDRAPYLGSNASSGGIPFIYFGGKFVSGGATYDPSVLQGKSADEIAAALSDPTNKIARGAVGTANTFTAAICSLTHNQPAQVCTSPAIAKIAAAS
jgi:thiol-disulfide isomerase/thioredoxin